MGRGFPFGPGATVKMPMKGGGDVFSLDVGAEAAPSGPADE